MGEVGPKVGVGKLRAIGPGGGPYVARRMCVLLAQNTATGSCYFYYYNHHHHHHYYHSLPHTHLPKS